MKTFIFAFIASAAAAVIGGFAAVPLLKKLKVGQNILGYVKEHDYKSGTPTMGGLMFIIAVTVVCLTVGFSCMANGEWGHIFILVFGLVFGAIGFLDDYIKVVKKRNLGLKAGQKTLGQLLVAVLYLAAEYIFAPHTTLWIPFAGEFDIGFFYYPVMLFIIIGAVNAVNLTDGIDGLASSVTMVAAMGFLVISSIEGFVQMNLLAAALAGVCLGFLVWNFHPAKVFMGDTGSMFLGGLVVALAFGLRMPVILIFVGIVYVAETMSDIIQIGSVKLTGKRVFKMAPIHHHFEMCGWSEVKIVAVFSAVTALGCIIAVLMVL